MTTTIKITELSDIGANLSSSTVLPVVDMTGTPTTQKTIVGNIANVVLNGAGVDYVAAHKATTAETVTTNAQPNITSVGTLTNLQVTGNVYANSTVRGATVTALYQLNAANLGVNGLSTMARVNITNSANLGAVANVHITGGTNGQVLTTNGSGNLSWSTVSGNGGGNTGNITFNGDNIESTHDIVNILGNNYAQLQSSNTYIWVEDGQADIAVNGNTWTFNNQGYMTIPNEGSFGALNSSVLSFSSQNNKPIFIEVIDTGNSAARQWVFDNAGNLTLPDGTILQGDGSGIEYPVNGEWDLHRADGQVYIGSVDDMAYIDTYSPNIGVRLRSNENDWIFSPDGGLSLPGGAVLTSASDTLVVNDNFSIGAYSSETRLQPKHADANVEIATLATGSIDPSIWTFDTNGNLTLPNNSLLGDVYEDGGVSLQAPANSYAGINSNNKQQWIETDDIFVYVGTAYGTGQDKQWKFDTEGNITLPSNSSSINYANGSPYGAGGGNANTGNVTFNDVNIIGDGNLYLQPDPNNSGAYLDIFLTSGPDVHLVASQSANLILGKDNQSNVMTSWNGNVTIQSWNINTNTQGGVWTFGGDGNLLLPNGTRISNKETNLIKGPALNSFGSNSYTGIFTTLNYTGLDTTWVVNGPGVSNGVIQSIDAAGQTIILDRNSGGPQFQDGENYTFTGPLVSIGTDITVNGNSWNFGTNGLLTIPTGAKIGGGGGGVFATDNTVTTSLDLRDTSGRGFYTNTDGYTLRSSGSKNWIFDTAGKLTTPGDISIRGSIISFPGQYGNINWGPDANTYGMNFSQYGRININTDFFANANVIGAQYLKGDGSNISNISVPKIANGTSNVNIPTSNGNVVITANGSANWTFDTTGNLQTAGDIVGPANANFTIFANGGVHDFVFGSDGTFYAPDNVVLGGTSIAIGPGADVLVGQFANAVLVASSNSEAYIQAIINNVSDNGSADWVAQGHHSDDAGGWADMGFTSAGFGDANYSITGQGDGYLFAQSFYNGQAPGGRGGNLVLATGENGTVNDIIFGTGGFQTANIFGRISDANNAFEITRANASLSVAGNISGGNISTTGNVTANNFSGNINITGNVTGTSPNVTLVAGSYSYTFDNTGNFTLPANSDILMSGINSNIVLGGTITATNFTSYTNSWTLATGTNTVSLTVPLNGVYSIWVRGNIPNGIVTYTATAVVSNPNTPVVGSSYGWYYAAGNALVLTSIPTQFVGTVNNISNAVVSTTSANVFTFGITNNSGASQVVSYGYTRLG